MLLVENILSYQYRKDFSLTISLGKIRKPYGGTTNVTFNSLH